MPQSWMQDTRRAKAEIKEWLSWRAKDWAQLKGQCLGNWTRNEPSIEAWEILWFLVFQNPLNTLEVWKDTPIQVFLRRYLGLQTTTHAFSDGFLED